MNIYAYIHIRMYMCIYILIYKYNIYKYISISTYIYISIIIYIHVSSRKGSWNLYLHTYISL